MKPNSRLLVLSTALATAGLLALSGCAGTNETAGKSTHALVCPQCRRVEFRTGPPHYVDSKHECPGCQGVMETLFKEGKWKHKCSVCKDSPFTCPVFHP